MTKRGERRQSVWVERVKMKRMKRIKRDWAAMLSTRGMPVLWVCGDNLCELWFAVKLTWETTRWRRGDDQWHRWHNDLTTTGDVATLRTRKHIYPLTHRDPKTSPPHPSHGETQTQRCYCTTFFRISGLLDTLYNTLAMYCLSMEKSTWEKSLISLQTSTILIWLILPVVICLSQRLSHACLSINNYTVKLRTAH